MKRSQAAALGALLVVGLSGCAAPEVDPEEAQAWLDQQASVEMPGSLGSMSGMASPSDDAIGEHGIAITFEEPTHVAEVVFSCFGPETMSVDVTTDTLDSAGTVLSRGIRTDDLACADSPHTVEQVQDDTTNVMIDGLSADGQGAWSAFVVGED